MDILHPIDPELLALCEAIWRETMERMEAESDVCDDCHREECQCYRVDVDRWITPDDCGADAKWLYRRGV
jgi:hypothetical protein